MKWLVILFVFSLTACGIGKGFAPSKELLNSIDQSSQLPPESNKPDYAKAINAAARALVRRPATIQEYEQAVASPQGYETVVRSYLEMPEFRDSIWQYHRTNFGFGSFAGGNRVDDDGSALATHIVTNNRDYREVLLATYCVQNTNGIPTQTPWGQMQPPCNVFANQADADANAAGVLSSRGFLTNYLGPFNFKRVKEAFRIFACTEYPDGDSRTTGLPPELISNVAKGSTLNFDKQVVDDTPACYSCHGSMNPRAALFFNFNRNGAYVASPAGQLFPPNTAVNDLNQNTTVRALLADAAGNIPIPKYRGEEVRKLREYATLLANSNDFADCQSQRLYNHLLGRGTDETMTNLEYRRQLGAKLTSANYNLKELIVEILKSNDFLIR